MSATLIAVVLALILGHTAAPLTQLRRFGWFTRWLDFLREQFKDGWYASAAATLVSLGLPLALCGLVQHWLDGRFFGLPGFVFALAMLFYCWGPRDLDLDVEAALEATDPDAREKALHTLAGEGAPIPNDAAGAVATVFRASKRRWFGVLLWFLLLGPFGALLYRLTQRGAESAEHLPGEQLSTYSHLLAILEWPVAQLMTLGLALAGNFDAVYGAWRDWHGTRRGHDFDFDAGFLDAAAQASVKREHAEIQAELETEDAETGEPTESGIEAPAVVIPDAAPVSLDRSALAEAMGLVWRVLIVWLAVLAVFVLAGYA